MIERKSGEFYGSVTVSDRGQIVIPAQARRDLGIEIGEKLLVVAGPNGGLVLVRANIVGQLLAQWTDLARRMAAESALENIENAEETDET